jgi:hypothetical protein
VATISSGGLATAQSVGTTAITASQGGVTSSPANLTVTQASTAITLTASGSKVKGLQVVSLSWTGTSQSIDVRRRANGGSEVIVAANYPGTTYTDNLNKKGRATYDYRVCLTGSTATCSNTVRVAF